MTSNTRLLAALQKLSVTLDNSILGGLRIEDIAFELFAMHCARKGDKTKVNPTGKNYHIVNITN